MFSTRMARWWMPSPFFSMNFATGLSASGTCDGVNLSWNGVAGATNYTVFRTTNPDCVTGVSPIGNPTETTYADATAAAGTTYYYTVTNVRYTGPAPTVLAVAPDHGPQGGGTAITVFGSYFERGASVKVDGVPCTGVTFVNATTLQCVTPAGTVGAKEVKVTNPNGQFGSLAGGFTYDP